MFIWKKTALKFDEKQKSKKFEILPFLTPFM